MFPKIKYRPMRYQLMRRRGEFYANPNPFASYHGFVPFVNGGLLHE